MPETEVLDQVDENGNIIGQTTREEFHNNPDLIHAVVHCWIFNSKGEALFQQRSLAKKLGAGVWDISAGGHVPAGMGPEAAMLKEIEEELGVKDIKPVFVAKYLERFENQSELVYLYFARDERSNLDFSFDKREVQALAWMNPDVAMNKAKKGELQLTEWIYKQLPLINTKLVPSSANNL